MASGVWLGLETCHSGGGRPRRSRVFADMYTGWVYNKWEVKIDENDNPVTDGNGNPVLTTDGQNRASFMNKHMSDWIEVAIKNEN